MTQAMLPSHCSQPSLRGSCDCALPDLFLQTSSVPVRFVDLPLVSLKHLLANIATDQQTSRSTRDQHSRCAECPVLCGFCFSSLFCQAFALPILICHLFAKELGMRHGIRLIGGGGSGRSCLVIDRNASTGQM